MNREELEKEIETIFEKSKMEDGSFDNDKAIELLVNFHEQEVKELKRQKFEIGQLFTSEQLANESLQSKIKLFEQELEQRERNAFEAGIGRQVSNEEYYNQLMKYNKWSSTEQKLKDGRS